ncbi:hypothetical protein HY643_00860 [Candidatus Woesearchaeota archaeon]|nr:hypothetical protein [Candidatus Woesearchaeota archaeon]
MDLKKNSFNKKGAVELSMTTIIVIVLGVTILSLALVWIRGVMSQVGGLTQGAFEKGAAEISEIFGEASDPLVLSPKRMTIKQGATGEADFHINNLGESAITVKAQVESIGLDKDKLVCAFSDTLEKDSEEYTLDSGKGAKLRIVAEDKESKLGNKGCKITVDGLANVQDVITLTIEIVK